MKTIKADIRSNTGTYASAVMLLLWMFLCTGASGQVSGTTYLSFNVNIPQITLIDIEPQGNNNISFSVVPPAEAGNRFPESGVTNNSLWMNYTNSRLVNGPLRSIKVQVLGDMPGGVILQLQASPRSATCGRGDFGTPAGLLTLSNSPQELISGIGGSFTGDGTGCGHQLTFTFKVTNYESLQYIQNRTLQLTYTLADN